MLTDITTREDIEKLVNAFYTKVKLDDTIGYIFNKVAQFDWGVHIPIMYDFWDTVLLGNTAYKGNPIRTHIDLNKKEQLVSQHFDRWIELFNTTIDENFIGDTASKAKEKAVLMAQLIQMKITDSKQKGYIH